jgi:tRNA(Ile)-lysidine synthase TilS/MesJ
MQCDKCGNELVIFQQYSGRHLCREHFVIDIESRIKRDIRAGRWMRPGDHLAVALSGYKRNRALLFFFHKLTAQRRDIRLSAIVIDEGIGGRRDLKRITEPAENLGIPCNYGSFNDEFQLTIDELARDTGAGSPCIRCRQLRRNLIGTMARREGITRIISGRTLEDLATGVLGNILTGQIESLLPDNSNESPVQWIDPLASVPRAEADLWADILCPGSDPNQCPYCETGFFDEVREILDAYTLRHPATPFSVSAIGKTLSRGCGSAGQLKEEKPHAA